MHGVHTTMVNRFKVGHVTWFSIACCVPELRTIEFRPFPIENVLGGQLLPPPSTFSIGNRQNSPAHTSHTQQAVVIKLEISSK